MRAAEGDVVVVDDVPSAFMGVFAEAFRCRLGDRFAAVLSGGPTARACYERLVMGRAAVDWPLVDVLIGDERCVPADHPDSNSKMVEETLVQEIAQLGSFHPMSCEGVASYEALVERSVPFDLVHLGLGPDGHTASLFSGSSAMHAPEGVFVAPSSDPSGKNPYERLTLTYHALREAHLAVFTVSGPQKKAAFDAVMGGDDLPASRVEAERIVWLIDLTYPLGL